MPPLGPKESQRFSSPYFATFQRPIWRQWAAKSMQKPRNGARWARGAIGVGRGPMGLNGILI